MRKLFLGICFSLIAQIVLSQSISGTVRNSATGAPIAAATIELSNGLQMISNDQGAFQFARLKKGNYVLKVSSIGFKTIEKNVSTENGPADIRMEEWKLFMQPVEVRATRAGDKAPFTKTNISKKEIELLNLGQDLPFLINQTPSVVVNSDAGNGVGYTGLRIRGSDATRINMTINGIPYNDAESQGLFFVNLPDFASSVNNIQIQRGVGTSSNGAGAFGASINFSTNEVNTLPYAEINNSIGSFNTRKHTIKAGTGILGDHFTLDARVSKMNSDGFVDRASSDLSSVYLSGAYLTEKTSIRLNVIGGKEKTYQAWYGITAADLTNNRTANYAGTERPGSPYDNETDNYQQDHFQLFLNHQFNNTLSFNTAFFLTKGRGYYEQYKAGESYGDYGLPNFISGRDTLFETDLIRQLWLDNSFYGQIFSLQYKSQKQQLTFGGGWNTYKGNHFGLIKWATAGITDDHKWYDLDARKTDFNLYGKYLRTLATGLYGFADLQYRTVDYTLNGFRNNPSLRVKERYHFLNPKFGFTYTKGQTQWQLSYALGQKEPNRDDFEAGKQQLPKPEKLHNIEMGVEQKSHRGSWAANLFYMRYRDQLVLTGAINDVGAYTRTNIPNSYRLGLELQGRTRVTDWFQMAANITLSQNKVLDFTEYYDDYDNGGQKSVSYSSTDIAYSPNVTAGASLTFIPVKNVSIILPGKYVSRQYLDNTSRKDRSLNAFYVQDLMVQYTISKKIFREIRMVMQVNNLFDKKYEPNGYTFSYQYGGSLITENYYFPMAGRNLMFAVNISL